MTERSTRGTSVITSLSSWTRSSSTAASVRTCRVTSRSVNTPMAAPPSATTTDPMSCSIIARSASRTVASGATVTTSVVISTPIVSGALVIRGLPFRGAYDTVTPPLAGQTQLGVAGRHAAVLPAAIVAVDSAESRQAWATEFGATAVDARQINPTRFTTHRFPLAAAMDVYDTLPGRTRPTLEVLMTAQGLRWTTAALLPRAAHLSRVHVLAVAARYRSCARCCCRTTPAPSPRTGWRWSGGGRPIRTVSRRADRA